MHVYLCMMILILYLTYFSLLLPFVVRMTLPTNWSLWKKPMICCLSEASVPRPLRLPRSKVPSKLQPHLHTIRHFSPSANPSDSDLRYLVLCYHQAQQIQKWCCRYNYHFLGGAGKFLSQHTSTPLSARKNRWMDAPVLVEVPEGTL